MKRPEIKLLTLVGIGVLAVFFVGAAVKVNAAGRHSHRALAQKCAVSGCAANISDSIGQRCDVMFSHFLNGESLPGGPNPGVICFFFCLHGLAFGSFAAYYRS